MVQSGQHKECKEKQLELRLNRQIPSARDHRFLVGLGLMPIGMWIQ